MKHSYSNDDTRFSIDIINEILEEDEGSKILHSIEGTILEEKLFTEFDEFMAMTADENSESDSETEEPPFEKITFNTDYKIKTSIEELPSDLELKPLPDNLEYEKFHFMVKEGIVLGHKVSSAGLEVNKAKIDVISKLPPPTNVKGIRSFLGHAVGAILGQKDGKHFHPIYFASKTLNAAQQKYTVTEKELMAIVFAFDKFRSYLMLSKMIVYTDHSPLRHLFKKQDAKLCFIRWILLLQEFDIEIKDKKDIENVAADHLSRIDNDEKSDDSDVNDNFPGETLMEITTNVTPWFADFANYLLGDIIPKGMTYQQKNKFFSELKTTFGKTLTFSKYVQTGPFPKSYKFEYILVAIDYVSKWAKAQALPTNDARVVISFLKKLFCHFGMPKALISDRGTHFCNKIIEKTMKRYGVNHRFFTSYHPQTSRQVKNTNRALKRILERTVKDNPTIWSRKLDDALWAFRIAYKTPTGTTPYKLVYGKNCHLPFEIKHRTYWALKNYNPDLIAAGGKRMF
ncbi:reverse transcriptase domain-containing protein [Tanacetum coccineum]